MLLDAIRVQAQTNLVVGNDRVGLLLLGHKYRFCSLLLDYLGLERRLETALIH